MKMLRLSELDQTKQQSLPELKCSKRCLMKEKQAITLVFFFGELRKMMLKEARSLLSRAPLPLIQNSKQKYTFSQKKKAEDIHLSLLDTDHNFILERQM